MLRWLTLLCAVLFTGALRSQELDPMPELHRVWLSRYVGDWFGSYEMTDANDSLHKRFTMRHSYRWGVFEGATVLVGKSQSDDAHTPPSEALRYSSEGKLQMQLIHSTGVRHYDGVLGDDGLSIVWSSTDPEKEETHTERFEFGAGGWKLHYLGETVYEQPPSFLAIRVTGVAHKAE